MFPVFSTLRRMATACVYVERVEHDSTGSFVPLPTGVGPLQVSGPDGWRASPKAYLHRLQVTGTTPQACATQMSRAETDYADKLGDVPYTLFILQESLTRADTCVLTATWVVVQGIWQAAEGGYRYLLPPSEQTHKPRKATVSYGS